MSLSTLSVEHMMIGEEQFHCKYNTLVYKKLSQTIIQPIR